MNLTLTISIPDDFKKLCEIFNIEPEHVIQALANKVSFPVFYSQPNSRHRWANFFFLDHLVNTTKDDAARWETHKPFMDRMVNTMSLNSEESEEANRAVMTEWHQFILNKRTEELIDRLKAEHKD